MKFNITKEGNVSCLVISAEKLDSKVAPDLKSQFIVLANDLNSGDLIVDLGKINFADSSGLSALLLAYRLYRETDRSLVFYSLSERIQKLIEISQLSSVFNTSTDKESALAHLNPTQSK